MVTVQQVYDMAIHLADEHNEANGGTVSYDTQEYRFRTISILNSVIPALYPYSGTYESGEAGRPCPEPLQVSDYAQPDFTQAIPLDDTLCLSLLPYFLAAQLLAVENESLSHWFLIQYREMKADLKDKIPGSFQPIAAPYGLF